MKLKFFFCLFFLGWLPALSQTEKAIRGRLLDRALPLEKAEVINRTSKISCTTDVNGEFVIRAKANDSLYFYAAGYLMNRIKLSPQQFESTNLLIALVKKPEELEEVVIHKVEKWKLDENYERQMRQKVAVERSTKGSVAGVYDGSLVNAVDFAQIGKILWGFLTKDKIKKESKTAKVEFAVIAKEACEQAFFLNTLKLKDEEIELFLQFCVSDPQAHKLDKDSNVLLWMDFLMSKNKEFQLVKQ